MVVPLQCLERSYGAVVWRPHYSGYDASDKLLELQLVGVWGGHCSSYNGRNWLWLSVIPKNTMVTSLNDYRPMTSFMMKALIFRHLLCTTRGKLDPFQFTYQARWSIDNAVLPFTLSSSTLKPWLLCMLPLCRLQLPLQHHHSLINCQLLVIPSLDPSQPLKPT